MTITFQHCRQLRGKAHCFQAQNTCLLKLLLPHRLHRTVFTSLYVNNAGQLMNGSKSHSPVDSTDRVPVARPK